MTSVADVRPFRVECSARVYFGGHPINCRATVERFPSPGGSAYGRVLLSVPMLHDLGPLGGVKLAVGLDVEGVAALVPGLLGVGACEATGVAVGSVGVVMRAGAGVSGECERVFDLTVTWSESETPEQTARLLRLGELGRRVASGDGGDGGEKPS